jgi:putative ABC transport system permease protein
MTRGPERGPPPSRLRAEDVLRVAAAGPLARRSRAALAALGIAIGVATTVAVLGLSASSRAGLLATIDRLGTNLLTVAPGQSLLGEPVELPPAARAMLERIDGVQHAAALKVLDRVTVRRTDLIAPEETSGIFVAASDSRVHRALGTPVRRGRFLDAASSRLPVVVLGAVAAERLGMDRVGGLVWLAERWFTVIGILAPATLDAQIDRSALIGFPYAIDLLGADRSATTIYVRAAPDDVPAVRELLAPTANPLSPHEVGISRPSDVLAARSAAESAFTGLFLGLGAVALLVGGVGVANVMVISVLERRSEIGVRRALGATRRHIAIQFLAESLLLAGLGGLLGTALGAAATAGYALERGWQTVLPAPALGGGVVAALAVGAVAGLYPAMRAARMSPTDALRSL